MSLPVQTGKYYDWDDVEKFLCDSMGIPHDKFRNYHKIVGGSYKDFWHVWLSIVNNDVINGKQSDVWFDMLYDDEEAMVEEYGEWVRILFPAIEKLHYEVDDDSITILYNW